MVSECEEGVERGLRDAAPESMRALYMCLERDPVQKRPLEYRYAAPVTKATLDCRS